MFNLAKDVSDNCLQLSFEGDVDITQAPNIKNELLNAINNYEIIKINIGNATNIDLSFFQLLCAAHQTAAQKNKQIYFVEPIPEFTKDFVAFSGFLRKKGCYKDTVSSCVWANFTKRIETAA